MSDNNEIDDILNELKNKRTDNDIKKNADKRADDFFYTFTPPEKTEKNTADQSLTFDLSFNDDNKTEKAAAFNESNNFEIINDSFRTSAQDDPETNEIYTQAPDDNGSGKKKAIIIAVAVVLIVAIAVGVFAFVKGKNKEEETKPSTTVTTTAAPVQIVNPLTGEASFNEKAVGKRPVACVVENAYDARPQWGIDDSKNAPDIIMEGEVEGGETRMLWLYADYTSLPSQIGPMRSARPPFIKFSELFDSIFIHWGQSTSKGDYIGADAVFRNDNVDHINQMAYSDSVGLFGRDSSRGVSSEHTGVLYGEKLEQAIKESEFRTDADSSKLTKFSFNKEEKAVGTEACNAFALTFSSSSKTRDWTYNSEDKMYHCQDYRTDVTRKNLLVLYDTTEYITKYNYKGSGNSEIYCDYKLSGGNGKLVSLGTITPITWSVENGVIVIKDANGKNVNLNPGTTWIGYASSNHGGTDKNGTATAE